MTQAIAVLRECCALMVLLQLLEGALPPDPHCSSQRAHFSNTPIVVPGGHVTLRPSSLFLLVRLSISSQLYIALRLSGFKTNFYYNNLFIPIPNYSIRKGHF